MYDEPKSMLRYVPVAIALITPLLYFISSHVNEKVAPLSAFVAQIHGVPQNNGLAQAEKYSAIR